MRSSGLTPEHSPVGVLAALDDEVQELVRQFSINRSQADQADIFVMDLGEPREPNRPVSQLNPAAVFLVFECQRLVGRAGAWVCQKSHDLFHAILQPTGPVIVRAERTTNLEDAENDTFVGNAEVTPGAAASILGANRGEPPVDRCQNDNQSFLFHVMSPCYVFVLRPLP